MPHSVAPGRACRMRDFVCCQKSPRCEASSANGAPSHPATRVAAASIEGARHVALYVFIALRWTKRRFTRTTERARDASPGARVRPPRAEQGRQKVFEMRSEGIKSADSSFRSTHRIGSCRRQARCKSASPCAMRNEQRSTRARPRTCRDRRRRARAKVQAGRIRVTSTA